MYLDLLQIQRFSFLKFLEKGIDQIFSNINPIIIVNRKYNFYSKFFLIKIPSKNYFVLLNNNLNDYETETKERHSINGMPFPHFGFKSFLKKKDSTPSSQNQSIASLIHNRGKTTLRYQIYDQKIVPAQRPTVNKLTAGLCTGTISQSKICSSTNFATHSNILKPLLPIKSRNTTKIQNKFNSLPYKLFSWQALGASLKPKFLSKITNQPLLKTYSTNAILKNSSRPPLAKLSFFFGVHFGYQIH